MDMKKVLKYYDLVEDVEEYERYILCLDEEDVGSLAQELEDNGYGTLTGILIAKEAYYYDLSDDGLEELIIIDDEMVGISIGGGFTEVDVSDIDNWIVFQD